MTIMIKYLFWSLLIWKTSIYSATMWSVWYNYSFFCSFFLYTVINGNSKKMLHDKRMFENSVREKAFVKYKFR